MEGALNVIRAPAFANWILFKAGLSLLQGPGGASVLMVTAEAIVLGEAWEKKQRRNREIERIKHSR